MPTRNELEQTLSDLKATIRTYVIASDAAATQASKQFGPRSLEHDDACVHLSAVHSLQSDIVFLDKTKGGRYPSSNNHNSGLIIDPSPFRSAPKKSSPLSDIELETQIQALSDRYKTLSTGSLEHSQTTVVDKQLDIKARLKSGARPAAADDAAEADNTNSP